MPTRRSSSSQASPKNKVSSTLQPPNPHSWGKLGVSFCYIFLHNSLMNILQRIFTDHYEEMIYTLHPRASVIENVDKMINCGNPSYGGAMYGCPHCGKLKFVAFRCHSRSFLINGPVVLIFRIFDISVWRIVGNWFPVPALCLQYRLYLAAAVTQIPFIHDI